LEENFKHDEKQKFEIEPIIESKSPKEPAKLDVNKIETITISAIDRNVCQDDELLVDESNKENIPEQFMESIQTIETEPDRLISLKSTLSDLNLNSAELRSPSSGMCHNHCC
jgi:hypothetical protein